MRKIPTNEKQNEKKRKPKKFMIKLLVFNLFCITAIQTQN